MYRHSFVLHSVIQTRVPLGTNTVKPRVEITYYEVLRKVYNGYDLAKINPTSGDIQGGYGVVDGHPLIGLGLVAPTHPVYIRWAARRLQDRLEGLDRS